MPRRASSRVSYSFSHTSRLFEFPEPALDEGLRLGVAVAAAAMADAELGEPLPEAAGGERRAIVAAERELAGLDRVGGRRPEDQLLRFDRSAAELQLPGDDLAGAAVDDRHQVGPAVLGHPDRGQVALPQLPGPLDPEEAGPLAALERFAAAAERVAAAQERLGAMAGRGTRRQREAAAALNAALMAMGRALIPVNYTAAGPFDHDRALPVPPVPLLQPAAQLRGLAPDSDEFLTRQTRLVRDRNRVTEAIERAADAAEQALARVEPQAG